MCWEGTKFQWVSKKNGLCCLGFDFKLVSWVLRIFFGFESLNFSKYFRKENEILGNLFIYFRRFRLFCYEILGIIFSTNFLVCFAMKFRIFSLGSSYHFRVFLGIIWTDFEDLSIIYFGNIWGYVFNFELLSLCHKTI